MSNIFNGNYTRLDDDTSFQIVRTNPLLTTNTKLMYDGGNMYLESYDANPLLVNQKYKNVKISGSSPFNRDIRNFLLGTHESAYDVGQKESDYLVCDSYDKQFETMYWCGAESIKSKQYPQEFGFIAPLYIRKKLPNYFVIFRVDGPSNHNLNKNTLGNTIDNVFDIDEDVMKKARILKSFDLREGTPIGNYLKKYVEQTGFVYDRSVHVNFSSNEITYYGIDKKYGVMTTKKENFRTELLENDNTVMHSDDWITNGFSRNNLIFPYIINFEFLFDDNDTEDFRFSRYFGLYCNDMDLFDFEAKYRGNTFVIDKPEEVISEKIVKGSRNRNIRLTMKADDYMDGYGFNRNDHNSFYYVKDKYNNLHQVMDVYPNPIMDNTKIVEIADRRFDLESVCGFETNGVSAYGERLNETVRSEFSFIVNRRFRQGESIRFYLNGELYETFTAVTSEETAVDEDDSESLQIPAGQFDGPNFSAKGTIEDSIRALCGAINAIDDSDYFFEAIYNGRTVVIRCVYADGNDMTELDVVPDSSLVDNRTINVTSGSGHMEGGCGNKRNTFKVYTSDSVVFKSGRYLKTGNPKMRNAEIKACVQYVNKDDEIEKGYNVVVTDDNGTYVRVSNTDMVEIVDRFYPKFGVLGFFPVMDFDFDTVYSRYGDDTAFIKDCGKIEEKSTNLENYKRGDVKSLSTGYFKDHDWRRIESEYEYFMENLIPEMSVENKSVPYISKWGFYDEQKDSCENPYRLNMSKIFGTSNLSANTFTYMYSVNEHTHSMPYYMVYSNDSHKYLLDVKEYGNYQYVIDPFGILNYSDNYEKFVERWVDVFMDTETDNFEKLLCVKSSDNKRFTKKYSRFDFGDKDGFSSTLFRGVKFNVKKIVGGNETPCSDYNGYKFAFLYIPKEFGTLNVTNKVHFVKNDTFRYIIGFVVVNTLTRTGNNIISGYTREDFCKSYVYAGCYGLLTPPYPGSLYYNPNQEIFTLEIKDIPVDELFGAKKNEYGEIDIAKVGVTNQMVRLMIENLDNNHIEGSEQTKSIRKIKIHDGNNLLSTYTDGDNAEIITDDGMIIINNSMASTIIYAGENSLFADIEFNDRIVSNQPGNIDRSSVALSGFYSVFESMSAYNIKQNINDDFVVHRTVSKKNVAYYSTNDDTYKVNIEDPVSFNTYDTFKSTPQVVPESGVFVPCCSTVTIKDNPNEVSLKTINRYSGYYNPIFNDILFFDDYRYTNDQSPVLLKFSNTRIDTDYEDIYGSFGKIKNLWFHKVNEEYPDKIITMTDPLYPAINQFALDHRDFNVFESNWDDGYFTTQLDLDKHERCPGTVATLNKPSMFGSKLMNVPDEITIDTFNGCDEWNDDFISDTYGTEKDIMMKEINGNSARFYLFFHKRIVRYFEKESGLADMFEEYLNPDYSFGDKTSIEDDIRSYIEKNIMGLYRIESVRMWVKRNKEGVHDSRIENDYTTYLNTKDTEKIRRNLQKTNTFNISSMTNDGFDRCLTYNFKTGFKECFGFSFTIKRI